MDDILVHSTTLEEHAKLLKQVFDILRKNEFHLKWSKCAFAQPQLEYLGHIISSEGVATKPSKIAVVASWLVLTSVKQLRGFLGLTGYYRRFIKHYGIIIKPLTNLLKKGTIYQWTSETQQAFKILQRALQQALVLAVLNYQ
jgi:hypothetical protein